MKTKIIIAGMFVSALLAGAQTLIPGPIVNLSSNVPITLTATATNDLPSLLQRGLFEEEGNRDYHAAIASYQSLITQFDQNRQLAATAVFRLGECYRKLGRTNEAVAQYDRIVQEFSDQQTLATLSRQNIPGLRQSPNLGDAANADGLGNASEEAARLATQLKGIEQLKDSPEEQARAVLAFFPDETLKKMLLQLPKLQEQESIVRDSSTLQYQKLLEKLAEKLGYSPSDANGSSFHTAYSPDGPEPERHGTNLLTDAHSELTKQLNWIRERVDFTVGIQKARLQVLQSVAAKTPSHEVAMSDLSSRPDEEEKEIRRIQTMIQNSPDLINIPVPGGLTPLSSAAAQGQLRVAQYLIDHGAEVTLGVHGITPLSSAVLKGNKAMVEFLLSRGANINTKDDRGNTPLHTAVANEFRAVAEALVAHHADVNARNNSGATPLQLAAGKNNAALMRWLIAHGADVNAPDNIGTTPLSEAAMHGATDAVIALLDAKANPNSLGTVGQYQGWSPLHHAADLGNLEIAGALLDHGANTDAFTDKNSTRGDSSPLQLALGSNHPEVAKLLLQHRANPKLANTGGARPLALAIEHLKSADLTKALLDAGADVNAPVYKNGWLPLQLAVAVGDKSLVETVLAYHPEMNAIGADEATALDKTRGRPELAEIAELLRAHGAVDDVPRFDRITVSRPAASFSAVVFWKGTNDWNRFSLLELIAVRYGFITTEVGKTAVTFPGQYNCFTDPLKFPDFSHVIIHRPAAGGGSWKTIPVDLAEIFRSGDCSRDVWLEWGDVVEVPEADHPLGNSAVWQFEVADAQALQTLLKCVSRKINVVIQGTKKEIDFHPNRASSVSFMARPVLDASNLIRFSSDLAHVKVIRHDSATGQSREWILDCNSANNPPGLWLRDGDVIEVPDK